MKTWTLYICPGCDDVGDQPFDCDCSNLPYGHSAVSIEVIQAEDALGVLREFLDWFDSRFSVGGKALPGVTLWSIAERARAALVSGPQAQDRRSHIPKGIPGERGG